MLASLFFTWRTLDATWRNLGLAQSAQLSERFTRAIDQLGSDKLALRLGSIHALERISKDSQEDHGAIVEIVSAFIRESALWPPRESDRPGCRSPVVDEAKPKPCADIQAALNFLARRKWRDTESGLLDLSSSDLQGAILKNAHLEGADLRETHLEGADLAGAFLEEALLWGTHLEGANLMDSHRKGVYFRGTNLEGAKFWRADLRQAKVSPGINLKRTAWNGAILEGVDLSRANLQQANFYGVNFKGVTLRGADLTGASFQRADLTHVVGLTWEQLRSVRTHDGARLPGYLSQP